MRYFHLMTILLVLALAGGALISPNQSAAATAAELNRDVRVALQNLYLKSAAAKSLDEQAKAVLVFPGIVKGGFLVGGQVGEGACLQYGQVTGYYRTVQLSYGYQAGMQKYGYALFLMTDSGIKWINRTGGWEIGAGPSITIADAGVAKSFTTTTLQSEIYAFFFNQKGLFGGVGLQGTKITRIEK